jgi:hypothetical protein
MTDDGRTLSAYLLSCSHGTIAGVFSLPQGYVVEDLRWPHERVSEAFRDVVSKGFANHCATVRWVWIRKHLEWNPPENPNQWKAVRKIVSQIPSKCTWLPDFQNFFADLTGERHEPSANHSPRVSESVSVTVAVSGTEAGTGEGEPSRSGSEGQSLPGVRYMGDNLTRSLDEWKMIAGINVEAFERWLAWLNRKGKSLDAEQRDIQARQLKEDADESAAGKLSADVLSASAQAEVVEYCVGQGYKSLIPIADVRARKQGLTRKPAPTPEDARKQREQQEKTLLERLKAGRAARGLANFRDPLPQESSGSYETALRIEESRGGSTRRRA